MAKEIKYKLQGDGRDSWTVKEFDVDGKLISAEMVYEDPTLPPPAPKKVNLSNIDIDTLTPSDIQKLKVKLGLS